jgi:GNAT superfamily N-acetyltransferase
VTFTVRATRADDWREVRALRLEMLADTPNAFGETLDHATRVAEAEWRSRGARGDQPNGAQFAAIDDDGRWIGTMGSYVTARGEAMLVGVYVSPRFRGLQRGVTDALLAAVEDWCRPRFATLALQVHEQNPRARAAYERRGFEYTGARVPYILQSGEFELVMVKRL